MSLTVGSLFSGIGGLDLGLERAGMTVKWQSEIDPFCSEVLAKHWPGVPNLGDVTAIEWETVERVDLICGGYPCQPFSLAGGRAGEDDARHLWPYMRDAVAHLRPRFALLENVPGHLSLGFGRVLGDLAEIGYDTEWDCIPAAAVGAPHRRDRVFVLAYTDQYREPGQPVDAVAGQGQLVPDPAGERREDERFPSRTVPQYAGTRRARSDVADSTGEFGTDEPDRGDRVVVPVGSVARAGSRVAGGNLAPRDRQSRRSTGVVGGDVADTDRTPGGTTGRTGQAIFGPGALERLGRCRSSLGEHWAVEPDVGRVADGVPRRVDRLRALGNAVVPQVAEFIGRQLLDALQART